MASKTQKPSDLAVEANRNIFNKISPKLTTAGKAKLRDQLDADMEAFLAKGKPVKVLAPAGQDEGGCSKWGGIA